MLPSWFDYQVQAQTLNTGPHTLRLMAFGMRDRLGVEASDFGITTSTQSHRGVLSYVYQPDSRFKLLVRPAAGWDDNRVGLGTALSLTETGTRLGLRTEARWTPNRAWVLIGGAQVQASRLTVDAELPFAPGGEDSAFEATDTRWVTQPDPYAEVQLRPLKEPADLLISAGVRMEGILREGLDPETALSPRGSLRWSPYEDGVLKAGAALVHQMPTSRALVFSPDTQLKLERAATAELGWEQRLDTVATLDTVVYGRTMERIATQQFGRPSFENEGVGR